MANDNYEHSGIPDRAGADDVLSCFVSERDIRDASSASKLLAFSSIEDFPAEQTLPPAARPSPAAPTERRAKTAALTVPVNGRGATPASGGVRRAMPIWFARVRWAISLAVLLSPFALVPAFSSSFVASDWRDDTRNTGVMASARGEKQVDPQPSAAQERQPEPRRRKESQSDAAERRSAISQIQPASGGVEPWGPAPSAADRIRSAEATRAKQVAPADVLQADAVSINRPVFLGAIRVDTQPGGAQVYVDGQYVGMTPLNNQQLPAGSHVVRIERLGYERWSGVVRAVANTTVDLEVTLQPTRQD